MAQIISEQEATRRVREAVRKSGVPVGHVRVEVPGHGQYQCTAKSLDAMLELYWDEPLGKLSGLVKEGHGDPAYATENLTRVELIMILQELEGHASN